MLNRPTVSLFLSTANHFPFPLQRVLPELGTLRGGQDQSSKGWGEIPKRQRLQAWLTHQSITFLTRRVKNSVLIQVCFLYQYRHLQIWDHECIYNTKDLPLAIILQCAAVSHAIRTAPSTQQTGVLLAQNYFSLDSTMKETGKDKWRKRLEQMGAFKVPEKVESLKKSSIRWRTRKMPNANLRKLSLSSPKCHWEHM